MIDLLSTHQQEHRILNLSDSPLTGVNNVLLVGTPGFDDTTRTDMQVLKQVSQLSDTQSALYLVHC